ncbi:MAG: hypothetical protein FJX23_00135 [Alphaproteobacteria bacterium]|nr:hypothetical protein [Alphaproteobacteria bacterium]
MNPFFWLFVMLIPVLVFAAKPEDSAKFRTWRLIGAILLGYAALNAMIYSHYHLGWHDYEICQSQFADGSLQQHPECGKPPKGLGLFFYPLIGWVFAAGYAGLCEFAWQMRHRRTIKTMGGHFKKGWFANFLIAIGTLIFVIYPICMMVSTLILELAS